jgi:hypothetical protein
MCSRKCPGLARTVDFNPHIVCQPVAASVETSAIPLMFAPKLMLEKDFCNGSSKGDKSQSGYRFGSSAAQLLWRV